MHFSHKPQITRFPGWFQGLYADFILKSALGMGLACALPVFAFTPEADAVLEALRDRMATGLQDETTYADFLSDLQEQDGCETWAADPLAQTEEVWEEIRNACPELEEGNIDRPGNIDSTGNMDRTVNGFGPGRPSLWTATQSVQPRGPGPAAPYMTGRGRNDKGGFSISIRDFHLYDRRATATLGGGFSLQAGHLHPDMSPTRLGFVAGRRFYAGWWGGSGLTGPLASPLASLDGIGLTYGYGDWRIQIDGAWNRLDPRGPGVAPDRRDAGFHALGVAHKNLRFQAAHQRFEPANQGRPLDITVGGIGILDPRDRWHLGGAVSRLDSGRGATASGAYGEIAWGSRDEKPPIRPGDAGREQHQGYRLEAHQATGEWANPLQSRRGYRQDTLDGQWILPGRGEGGFLARSRMTLLELGGFRADLESGGEAAWSLETDGLLAARSRLALIQSRGAWTYTAGTGWQYRRMASPVSIPPGDEVEEGGTGFGQMIAWRNATWRGKLSLILRGEDYQGPYPEPFALALEHWTGRFRNLGAQLFTGDIRDPASYLRLILKQEWSMGGGAALRQSLRLPWSRGKGWAGDLGYQVVLKAGF